RSSRTRSTTTTSLGNDRSRAQHRRFGRVAGPQFLVPVAGAVDGQLGDPAVADGTEDDLAAGNLLAVVANSLRELGDESRRGGHGAHYGDLVHAIGCVALVPLGEGLDALQLEPPQRRVSVKKYVVGEDVSHLGGTEYLGECLAETLGRADVGHGWVLDARHVGSFLVSPTVGRGARAAHRANTRFDA